jgi:molybdopterin molybdotransferase
MITVTEARQLILQHLVCLPPVQLPLPDARGLVTAEDILAPQDIPAFPQSGMDGYAFRFSDWEQQRLLVVDGEIPAGHHTPHTLLPGRAVRIFTGAAVPAGADTVVMQEKTSVQQGQLLITDDQLQPGQHVRPKGSETQAGSLALPKGSLLRPATIGYLAGLGITHVQVHAQPRTALIVTGNELQQPGRPLQYGQVYESNSFALTAVLQQAGLQPPAVYTAPDNLASLQQCIEQALVGTDVLLLTGGVSVGDYDFVTQALAANGVQQVFHRIKQRPGKPLFFGVKDNKLVFGLPGNPSSVLTCFYEYVLPALEQLMQQPASSITRVTLPLAQAYSKKAGLTHFLKGYCTATEVTPLDAQESYRMRSFALANCLICLEEERETFAAGEPVEVHVLPSR